MKILITGSAGLIGCQAAKFFHDKEFEVIGIDNNMRAYFFGPQGSNNKNLNYLKALKNYSHHDVDIRDYALLEEIFEKENFDMIIHAAAQPSHDWAAKEPATDFHVNAVGTFNLLELTRNYCPEAVFIFTSTNKVYGDRPNISHETGAPDESFKNLSVVEEETRYEGYFESPTIGGAWSVTMASIDESMSIDNCKHSIFGASKVAADVMCQEYGRYFGLKTGIFRGGCLTGPDHSGVELHGFLAYLAKCIHNNKHYKIFGYKGKQVRDNIHASDLINMFWHFYKNPRRGEVYNVGGGRENSLSVLEAIDKICGISRKDYNNYSFVKENREGDHIWYITDLSKFKLHYPSWSIETNIDETLSSINHSLSKL